MTNSASDVVIIGGGLIGLSLARRLALQRAKVTLLDQGQFGQEASGAGAGILAAQVDMSEADTLTPLAVEGRKMYADFVAELMAETGVEIEYAKAGLLYIALSSDEERELAERHLWQNGVGLFVEKLSREETLRLENHLTPELRSALHFPDEAYVDNVRLVEALKITCARLGVRLAPGCQATSLVREGARVIGVKSNLGEWPSGNVLIAAGSWSSQIESGLSPSFQVAPSRGQMVAVRSLPPLFSHLIFSSATYCVPRKDGRLLLGSTVERVGYDKSVTLGGVQTIISGAAALSPSIHSASFVNCWSGLRPHNQGCDGLPLMGATGIEGLYLATGHFRNGILLAPITAALITELLNTGKTPELLRPFTPPKFI